MAKNVAENIWTFPIILPDNPLKWLNCYVIKGSAEGRDLLIDTGFNRAECRADLAAGMEELGLRPENTDVFFTHAHGDHTGNAGFLQRAGCRLMMGRIDYEYMLRIPEIGQRRKENLEGVPADVMRLIDRLDSGSWMTPDPFEAELLEEGDLLEYGGYKLECVLTPGHCPGHLCLYDRERELMFTGDQVLFDITPNITASGTEADFLGDYMRSLKKIEDYPVRLALPGHRGMGELSFCQRVEELYEHHLRRLDEAESIVRENPGICSYQVARRMSWDIRANSWEEFPVGQKWFATGEALAHLMHLAATGKIERRIGPKGYAEHRVI